MRPRDGRQQGPSPGELKLRGELDMLRRELARLKRVAGRTGEDAHDIGRRSGMRPSPAPTGGSPPAPNAAGPAATDGAPDEAAAAADNAAGAGEIERLRTQVAELTDAKQRLSRLYFSQLEENRKRQRKLHQILETVRDLNAELDLDALLTKLVEAIRHSLAFQVVHVWLRDPGTEMLRLRASAGALDGEREALARRDLKVSELLAMLRDEFRVSRSYFISAGGRTAPAPPSLHGSEASARPALEWGADDVLFVPLYHRSGELAVCLTLRSPADRLVPSQEVVELLEIYGHQAVVAIENARLYRELDQHTREVEEAGRLHREMHELKSNFVSTVSHELRTPLAAIRAYLDTLMMAREGDIGHDQLHHFLSVMNDECQRLSRLIESVLDLNRYESGAAQMARQSVDLLEVVHETSNMLEPIAQVGQVSVKVVAECADTLLDASRDQMRQLALHLGSNAVKFTPPGGSVTMRVRGDEDEIVLEVVDTGIGIPADEIDRVFERFYQVDSSLSRRHGGTGLGLAICKSIADWHGGSVHVASVPGEGSHFTVRLPRRVGARVLVRPGPQPQAAAEDILRLAVEMVSEVMAARVVSMLCPEEGGDLVIRAALGLDARIVQDTRVRPGSGVAGWVARNRRPVCVSGAEERSEVSGSGRDLYRSRTFLSVPIESGGELLGVLNVTDPMADSQFHAEDCHLLLQLAERIAIAWRQALDVEERQADVEDTANTLRRVLQHLERGRRRAPDRVRLARALGRALQLEESEVGVISFAASVHDIGMRAIGEHVVEGAGELSEADRSAIRAHPEAGADLLEPLETVGVVRDVVLSHHEWWDGSGYPRGLKGEEIPIGGRILALVDAFESMTVGRAHRAPMSREQALEQLRGLAGQQFDPRVVEVFPAALEEVERDPAADGPARTDAGLAERRR